MAYKLDKISLNQWVEGSIPSGRIATLILTTIEENEKLTTPLHL